MSNELKQIILLWAIAIVVAALFIIGGLMDWL